MDQKNRTTLTAEGGDTQTVTRTRWGRRSPGGLFWLTLLLVPLLLAALATCTGKGGIQDDLTARSKAALEAQGLKGVGVSFDGRDGTLQVPAGVDEEKAEGAVAAVEGVRTVAVEGASTGDTGAGDGAGGAGDAAAPYSLSAEKGQVAVKAVVPTDADKKALLDGVKARAAGARVIDQVTVEAGAKGPDAAALAGLAKGLVAHPGAKAAWDGKGLTLSGQVPAEDVKAALGADAEALAPGKVQNLLVVKGTGTGDANAAACGKLDTALAAVQKRTKIQFAENSPALTSSSQKAINEIAALLKKCGDARVEVGGHTDNQGDPSTSKPLSQKRAMAVRAALIEAGIAGERLSARGYGESQPVASNATAEGQAANRRVEIKVQ